MESSSAGPKRIHPGFDIDKLRREAQTRWLKPSEVLFILQNHERYSLAPKAPEKPPSGSLFLFNRRVLRYFRKDGHIWRKKKDGRTIGEAHERLKVGNVDALNCYYAHGEQNPYFQRRSYWMLDPAYEHIVLVHYREVAEGRYISGSISNLSAESLSTFNQSTSISKTHFQSFTSGNSELREANQSFSSPGSLEEVSSKFAMEQFKTSHLNATGTAGNYVPSPQPEVNEALRTLAEQLSLDDDDDNSIYFEEKLGSQYGKSQDLGLFHYETRSSQESRESLAHGLKCRMQGQVEEFGKQNSCSTIHLLKTPGSGNNIERKESPSWKDMLELTSNSPGINTHGRTTTLLASEGVCESPSCMTSAPERQSDVTKHGSDTHLPSAEGKKISEKLGWQQLDHGANSAENRHNKYQISDSDLSLQLSATRRFLLGCDSLIDSPNSISQLLKVEGNHASGTSTLESNSSVMILRKGNSTDWIGALDSSIENNMYSFDLSGMWVDQSQFGYPLRTDSSLTMAQKQRFNIREISPEWAFSHESTKVVITGVFLCDPSESPWAVMFGDIEVPLEIVQEGVLRCKSPPHCAGKVTLCITSCNRESCSEIREFEFRSMPYTSSFINNSLQEKATKNTEELLLLVRLVQILLCGYNVSSIPIGAIKPEIGRFGQLQTTEDRWQQIFDALVLDHEPPPDIVDFILQELLKDKLQQWLMSKYQGKDGTGRLLSKQEQGIIHMISGLGFDWALNQILDSGVGINFRDINGWTALHWAAHFGREKMVAALLAAGASSGAVTDPTPQDPVGKTPAAISAASGHKGLAAYLSEVTLTGHLSSITMEESEIAKGSTAMDAYRAVESISERNVQMHAGATEDELSLKDCLAAVRNSAQAAARIQSAFRAHSFRKRQQKTSVSRDEYGMTPEVIHGLSAASKYQRAFHGYRDQKFDKAALSIQKKYRGWKGRKDFLNLRQHVVKIQAHVRGHQVRKKKELLWTVGVIEKVILRWRRRGVGLRGFRAEPHMFDEVEEDIVKVFRKQKVDAALDEAMSRVLSMVDSPEARQQYRRMLEKYCQAKAELGNGDDEALGLENDFEIIEDDDISPTFRL